MSLLTSQRVLILEDEPLIAIAIEDFLYDSGIGIVETAFNCQAARRRILGLCPTSSSSMSICPMGQVTRLPTCS